MVAPEQGVPGLGADVDPVLTGHAGVVATHHVAYCSAKGHADRVSLGVTDGVARDEVAIAALDLDRDALSASRLANVRGAVSGDQVVVAGDQDALDVSNEAVAPHPIAVGVDADSGAGVA